MNWATARNYYAAHPEETYTSIAKRYGVARSQVALHGRDENWPALREQKQTEIGTKTLEKIVEKESSFVAEQMARIDKAVEIAIGKAMEALLEIDPQDTQRHRQLVQNIKDLREMLRVDDGSVKQEIMVKIEDEASEWSK